MRFGLVTDEGVHRACCTKRCLDLLVGHGSAPGTTVPSARRPYASCVHCCWCGALACVPVTCALHARGCPPFRWEVTEAGREAVLEVRARADVAWFTPRALATFAEVAGQLRQAQRFPHREALVAGVLDRSVDWRT